MIAEAGLAALWLATAMAALQGLGLARRFAVLQRPAAYAGAALAPGALAALLAVFWRNDLSVRLVVRHGDLNSSAAAQAAAALLSGPGQALALLAALVLAAAVCARFERRLGEARWRLLLGLLGLAQLTLGLGILFAASPFVRLDPPGDFTAGIKPAGSVGHSLVEAASLPLGLACLVAALTIAIAARRSPAPGHEAHKAQSAWLLAGWIALTAAATASWRVSGRCDWLVLVEWSLASLWLAAHLAPGSGALRDSFARGPLGFRLLRTGGLVAVAGTVLLIGGIAVSHGLAVHQRLTLAQGQTGNWYGRPISVVSIRPVAGPGWTAIEAAVALGGGPAVMLRPQARTYDTISMESAGAQANFASATVRVALADLGSDDAWQLSLAAYPLAWLVPLGGLLVIVGGAMALAGRLAGDIRRATAREKIAWRRHRQGR